MSDSDAGSEVWKDVEGFDNRFQVSDRGRVRRKEYVDSFYDPSREITVERTISPKVLSPTPQTTGYEQVTFTVNGQQTGRLVHRLVMKYHGSEPPSDRHMIVNHIDGDKTNNCIENLEWVTEEQNRLHDSFLSVAENSGLEETFALLERWAEANELSG
jgi:hypothetical protein